MPVTRDQPGPYAPPSAILALVERHRNKGLPNPVDAEVLGRAGIPDSLINRTLQALQALDLITESGAPSEVLEGIRVAPEAEYKQRLTEWLNGAYADALAFVDPATDDEVAIRDAFRSYKPVGQQGRMVTLFMGLFAAAGVMPERAKAVAGKKPVNGAGGGKLRMAATTTSATRPSARRQQSYGGGGTGDGAQLSGFPPALAGLLQSLPKDGEGWTQAKRDRFQNAFGVMLDFCFPIVVEGPAPMETADDQ
jgi:hypothetical protein